MKKNTLLLLLLLSSLFLFSQDFVTVKNQTFYKNNKEYRFVGTNYWYGALLGKKNGDRKRLLKELNELKSLGIVNLRVLVGAEGGNQDYTVRDALQKEQGKYTQENLEGLDFLLSEMKKRNLTAVLYLNNNWEWSGGMAKYLEWNGYGKVPNPNIAPNTWPQFMNYTAQFHSCEPCKEAFKKYITFIINRTNTITKEKYIDDTTIMSWEVANEPRIWNVPNEPAFTKWLNETVSEIKNLDKNHLVTTGSEGKAGSNDDIEAFERTHKNPNIDYITMHIWPKNWGWYKIDDEKNTTQIAIKKTIEYIDEHVLVAQNLNKPLVLEEFGFPREKESCDKNSSVENRDIFYTAIFNRLLQAKTKKEPFVALNFWGYGGLGKNNPTNTKWNIGDDYTTDPPQEPQGLNSVFSTDNSTLKIMKKFNKKLKK